MFIIANELITSLIISALCVVMVLINIPRKQYLNDQDEAVDFNRGWIAFTTFVTTFIVSYTLIYFFAVDQKSSLITNMKSGEPPF